MNKKVQHLYFKATNANKCSRELTWPNVDVPLDEVDAILAKFLDAGDLPTDLASLAVGKDRLPFWKKVIDSLS